MGRNKWKKIVGFVLVVGVLVLSFWYGGNAPGLQGFSVSEETLNEEQQEKQTDSIKAKDNEGESDTVRKEAPEKKTSEDGSTLEEKKDTGLFHRIFMSIKKVKTSKNAKKSNPQINKKAQRNANRAVEKEKKKSKKKSSSQKSKQANNNDSSTENNTYLSDNNTERNNADSDNTDYKTDKQESGDNISVNVNESDGGETSESSGEDGSGTSESGLEAESTVTEEADSTEEINCTIYISCASVLNHLDKLDDSVKQVIPQDGVILETTQVTVKKDATVFDVLQKAARDNKVHLEYNYTPAYKTYYIEGIGNLYQFNAGNLSGWMYSVNDEFPGVGCSGYKVHDGDVIKWLYTCSFGKDVGDGN